MVLINFNKLSIFYNMQFKHYIFVVVFYIFLGRNKRIMSVIYEGWCLYHEGND